MDLQSGAASGGQPADGAAAGGASLPSWYGSQAQTQPQESVYNNNQDEGGQGQGQGETAPGITPEQLAQLQQMVGESNQRATNAEGVVAKLREALDPNAGKQDQGPDFGWYDDILNIAEQRNSQGQGIPVTVELATRLKETLEKSTQQEKAITELTNLVKQNLNPENLHDQRTYADLDATISETLRMVYGEDESAEFREFVNAKVAKEVHETRTKHPEVWKRLRQDPQLQKKLVKHTVRSLIPKELQARLKEEHLRNTPMTKEELVQAFAQADQLPDEELKATAKEKARQAYFESLIDGNKGNSFQGMLNRMR